MLTFFILKQSTSKEISNKYIPFSTLFFILKGITLHKFVDMARLLSYYFMVFLLCLLLACKQPQSFVYRELKNFTLVSKGVDQTSASMDLVFFNPNSYGVNLKNVNCDIFLENSFVGRFSLDTTLRIAGNSEFVLPAKMNVDVKSLIKNSLNLLFNNEVAVGAKGTTKVGKGGLFITIPFSYQGKQKLNLF